MSGSAEPYGIEGLPLLEARNKILAALKPTQKTEAVALNQALGRINAEPVVAPEAIPGFRASVMDGYALGQQTQPQQGDQWTLQGRSAPGAPFQGSLNPGEAIRILTGAPLPPGAGWVLPQELVCTQDTELSLEGKASDNPWIRAADEECKAEDCLLDPGQRLTPALLGRLASCGIAQLLVYQQPRIGLIISGDELVPAGTTRPPGTIWESNGTLLIALIQTLGQKVDHHYVVADEPQTLRQTLQDLSKQCDVVVSTGGVSAGDSDWIRPLVAELGAVEFWKLFLKPGRPFAFGTLGDGVPFFGLPGNPVAAAVTALQLLWPALQAIEGQTTPELFPRVRVELTDQLLRRPGRPELARARLDVGPSGQLLARLNGSQASSRIGSLEGADLLLELPADADDLKAGDELWAQLIRRTVF
ncbi:Molybdopterin binding domain [Synechococcus sp. BL107]|uniref:molybdopterin molybdotransferase MoeA n=1 Tax=Synechococcus sp. BL107 TaxID=313625 RepID=UPI0000E53C72|nr:gephyrin-like molybdotransferase Glp [Synechococcus sp. BL107]EAU71233.1 Molybdopterin binding domain [Synechococcus sp. BL107]